MKKTLLLFILCIGSIYSHAQEIDTALIKGRWELYSLGNIDQIAYRDSLDAAIKIIFGEKRAHNPDLTMTTADSLKTVKKCKIQFDIVFKTFLEFDGRRHVTGLISIKRDPGEDLLPETGEYKWDYGNEIIMKLGNGPPMELTVISLTEDKFVTKQGKFGLEMTFTRAK